MTKLTRIHYKSHEHDIGRAMCEISSGFNFLNGTKVTVLRNARFNDGKYNVYQFLCDVQKLAEAMRRDLESDDVNGFMEVV